jgi:hypothetical protein
MIAASAASRRATARLRATWATRAAGAFGDVSVMGRPAVGYAAGHSMIAAAGPGLKQRSAVVEKRGSATPAGA